MNDKVIIKNAYNPPSPIGWVTACIVCGFPVLSIILLSHIENIAIALVAIAILLIFIIALVKYERKNSKHTFDEYMRQKTSSFSCSDCSTPIAKSIEQDCMLSCLPILYHCKKCSVLWYAGMESDRAS